MNNKEFFIYKGVKGRKILQSMKLVEEYTGINYRTLIRKFKVSDILCDENGLWEVFKANYVQDGRKRNNNPNIK